MGWFVLTAGYGVPGHPGHLLVQGGVAIAQHDLSRLTVVVVRGRALHPAPADRLHHECAPVRYSRSVVLAGRHGKANRRPELRQHAIARADGVLPARSGPIDMHM
jgi:hypothetical protein